VKNRPQTAEVGFFENQTSETEFLVFEFCQFGSVWFLENRYPTFSLGSAHLYIFCLNMYSVNMTSLITQIINADMKWSLTVLFPMQKYGCYNIFIFSGYAKILLLLLLQLLQLLLSIFLFNH